MPYLTPPVSFCTMLRYMGYRELPDDPQGSYLHVWATPTEHPVEPPVAKEVPMSKPEPAAPLPDIASRLQQAFARKAEEEARVPLAAVETLLTDLGTYSTAIKKQAEEKALAAMLVAVGETAPTPTSLDPIQAKLRTSLAALLEIVGSPFVPKVVPEPAPSGVMQAPHAVEPEPELLDAIAGEPEAEDYDPEDIRVLIAKVDGLSQKKWKEHPPQRLLPLIQAYAAEIRYWQEKVSSSSHLHWQLGQSVKMLAAIKYDSGITEFVKGLAQDSKADWGHLAQVAYGHVRKFDQDAAKPLIPKKGEAPPSKPSKPQKVENEVEPAPTSFSWPKLPKLRAATAVKPLVFVGGIPAPNKIESVHERFGFEIEWVEVYRNKGDSSAITRVSNGTVGAVVILEKFLGHRTSEKLVEVCKAKGIPWAYGGNAGTATLQRALELLDTKAAA